VRPPATRMSFVATLTPFASRRAQRMRRNGGVAGFDMVGAVEVLH
jgi:hypothetical protein